MEFYKEWTFTPMSDHRYHKNANFITPFPLLNRHEHEFPNGFVIAFQPLVAPADARKRTTLKGKWR